MGRPDLGPTGGFEELLERVVGRAEETREETETQESAEEEKMK